MRGAAKIAVALALSMALAAPAPAGAAGPTGSTTLLVAPAKARALGERGVALDGVGGADTEGRQTRFQITGGAIAAGAASLNLEGGLRLVAGEGRSRHVVKLTGLRAALGTDSTLSAKLNGKRRRAVFDLQAPPSGLAIDETKGAARLHGARLVWRRAAAKALGERLGAAIPRGELGTLRISAATILDPAAQPGAVVDEPPRLARPASAVDVTAVSLTWHVRDSWIRYVNSETPPETLAGATAGTPAEESSHPCPDRPAAANPTLVYSYSFPFAEGWHDDASGTTALYGAGGIRFRYLSHGIDLTTRNPEIEINGAASRAILRVRGEASLTYPDKRVPFLALSPGAAPAEGPPGTFTYAAPVRGSLTAEGLAVFGDFASLYAPPANGFGCFSISFTTG